MSQCHSLNVQSWAILYSGDMYWRQVMRNNNSGFQPGGCEPCLERSRIDISCTKLCCICFNRVFDGRPGVKIGCYSGPRYKKGWKPQDERIWNAIVNFNFVTSQPYKAFRQVWKHFMRGPSQLQTPSSLTLRASATNGLGGGDQTHIRPGRGKPEKRHGSQ